MAHWQRKHGRYVTIYSTKDGGKVVLPRSMTKHLDGQPDHNIEAWVRQYEQQYEGRERLAKIAYDGTELSKLIQSWLAYLTSRGKSKNTVKEYERMVMRYVLPYFLEGETPLTDPQQWPGKSVKMLSSLQSKGVTDSQVVACNKALRSFYSYLTDEGRIQNGLQIRLRSPIKKTTITPLKKIVSPQEILLWSQRVQDKDLKLMALTGYFFSLRPQEIFSLKKADFGAGSKVRILECSKSMSRVGLYNKLAVLIQRQKTNWSLVSEPKAKSRGWVCCFNEQAARQIVALLADIEDDLFPYNNRKLYKMWETSGIKNVTLKDLRRSSLYWLGHNTDIQPLELMKHARHSRIDTTMLYVRRPEEELLNSGVLDLET
jgi:integrase